jgi:hypothetical protein
MTFQDEKSQSAYKHPLVKLTAICRRFLSMAEVLHDAVDSRLRVSNTEEVMELSEGDAADIVRICDRLLWNLFAAKKQLGGKSEALDEYESPHDKSGEDVEECPGAGLDDWSYRDLSLVRDAARDMADHVRSVWHIPPNWVAEQGLDRDEKRLEFVLVSLDWARRDILKQLAKLVMIFDDYDDPDSAKPFEAWLSRHAASRDE